MLEILKNLTIKIATLLKTKVDKVAGKSLISDTLVTKLEGLKDHSGEISNLTTRVTALEPRPDLTDEQVIKLKALLQGRRWELKLDPNAPTQYLTNEELASQLDNSQIYEVIRNDSGLEEFRFLLSTLVFQNYFRYLPFIEGDLNVTIEVYHYDTKKLVGKTSVVIYKNHSPYFRTGVSKDPNQKYFYKFIKSGNRASEVDFYFHSSGFTDPNGNRLGGTTRYFKYSSDEVIGVYKEGDVDYLFTPIEDNSSNGNCTFMVSNLKFFQCVSFLIDGEDSLGSREVSFSAYKIGDVGPRIFKMSGYVNTSKYVYSGHTYFIDNNEPKFYIYVPSTLNISYFTHLKLINFDTQSTVHEVDIVSVDPKNSLPVKIPVDINLIPEHLEIHLTSSENQNP